VIILPKEVGTFTDNYSGIQGMETGQDCIACEFAFYHIFRVYRLGMAEEEAAGGGVNHLRWTVLRTRRIRYRMIKKKRREGLNKLWYTIKNNGKQYINEKRVSSIFDRR
jgi:hypothetical protein